jgi:hypothetical protein|nr:hypothetical protein [Kofleriaceae bacterium]
MRNTSLWIAAALAALACGCNAKDSAGKKPPGAVSADDLGTFTCKTVQNASAAGSNSPCVEATDHFEPAVPTVYVTYRTRDLPKSGDTYAIEWIATDVGSAAPANHVIATTTHTVEDLPAAANSYTVNGYLTKPTNGWPVGTYRVDIKLGDKLATSAQFAIK